MPEEQAAAVAEPESGLKDFGNLSEVFDKVWTATAEKPQGDATPPPPESPPPPAAEPPKETPPAETPPPPAATAPADELPDFLTGAPPKETPPPAAEPELPPETAKDSKGMKQLRQAYNDLKAKYQSEEATWKKQFEEVQKTPATPPEAEAQIKHLQTQVEQLTGTLENVAAEHSPRFRQQYNEPLERLTKEGHELLKEAGVDPSLWDRAMALTGKSRIDALEDLYGQLPQSVAAELSGTTREIRSLNSRKEAELADRPALRQKLQQEQLLLQRQANEQQEKHAREVLDWASKDVTDRLGLEVYRKSDNPAHAKWNETVDKLNSDAENLFLRTTDERVMALASKLAPAALQYRYLYHLFRDRWNESEKQLKAMRGAEPDLKDKGRDVDHEKDEKVPFAQAVANSLRDILP